jgi:serine/threonine-protein kinase
MDPEVDLETSVHARVGTVVVGKYRLDRVIGIGGMAAVYAATHRNQAEFAVKMLHPYVSSRDDLRSRFLREGYIANSVKHVGAVRVVDDDVAEDGSAFLVMELLQGASVEDLWFACDRRLPLRPAVAVGHQLLDVLAAAHAKNIIHRDIKPANLFVTTTGDLKVLDFGIARLRDAGGSAMHATTQSGTMLGTPAFMAPEQARGQSKEVDGQTDVWAVGATLFALVSGHIVHEARNAPELVLLAGTAKARPLASVAPDVPREIAAVVDKALAFDKPARWESAAAMRDALRDAYKAAFREPLSRQVLAALHAEIEGGPPPSTSGGPARGTEASAGLATPLPDTVLAKTKVERPGAGAAAAGPSGPPAGLAGLQRTLPLAQAQRLPLGPAAGRPPPAVLTTSKPVSTEPTAPPAPSSRAAAPRHSALPFVLLGVLVVGVVVVAAVMLAGRGRGASPRVEGPPPAVSVIPAVSAAATESAVGGAASAPAVAP